MPSMPSMEESCGPCFIHFRCEAPVDTRRKGLQARIDVLYTCRVKREDAGSKPEELDICTKKSFRHSGNAPAFYGWLINVDRLC